MSSPAATAPAPPTAPEPAASPPRHGDCAICNIAHFPSEANRNAHLTSERHRRKAAAATPPLGEASSPAPVASSPPHTVTTAAPPQLTSSQSDSVASGHGVATTVPASAAKARRDYGECVPCGIKYDSPTDGPQHLAGEKHRKKLGLPKPIPVAEAPAPADPHPPHASASASSARRDDAKPFLQHEYTAMLSQISSQLGGSPLADLMGGPPGVQQKRALLERGGSIPREKLLREHAESRTCVNDSSKLPFKTSHGAARPRTLASAGPSTPITLRELRTRLDQVATGRHLLLRTIALPSPLTSVMLIAEDADENEDQVALYNYAESNATAASLDRALPIGTRLRIRNPWLKRSADGWRLIRVDNPADVQILDSDAEMVAAGWTGPTQQGTWSAKRHGDLRTPQPPNPLALKDRGNERIKQEDWCGAIKAYTQALSSLDSATASSSADASLRLALLGNRCEAYLGCGQFTAALADADSVLRLQPGQEKGVRRRMRALIGLERCMDIKADTRLSREKQQDLLEQAARLRKEQLGQWDIPALIQESHSIASHDANPSAVPRTLLGAACVQLGPHAHFVHEHIAIGVAVPNSASGRGVVARQSAASAKSPALDTALGSSSTAPPLSRSNQVLIPAHTFVLSEKAAAIYLGRGDTLNLSATMRSDRKLEPASKTELKGMLLRQSRQQPNLAHALSLLTAGEPFEAQRQQALSLHSSIPPLSVLLDQPASNDPTPIDPDHVSALVWRHPFSEPKGNDGAATAEESKALQMYGDAASCGLWFQASIFQHSCRPNCHSFSIGDRLFVRTLRDIREGEELTISFNPAHAGELSTLAERRDHQDFICQCQWCEIYTIHPELAVAESEMISAVNNVRTKVRPLLAQLSGPSHDKCAEQLTRLSAVLANIVAGFRSKVSAVCPDSCRTPHRHPTSGAGACLLNNLALPLKMQAFILAQTQLDSPSAKQLSMADRSALHRQHAKLLEEAANYVAHIAGPGHWPCVQLAFEPLEAPYADSATQEKFRQRRSEVMRDYELHHAVPFSFSTSIPKPTPQPKPKSVPGPGVPLPDFLSRDHDEPDLESSSVASAVPTVEPALPNAALADANGDVKRAITLLFPLLCDLVQSKSPVAAAAQAKLQITKKLDFAACLKVMCLPPFGPELRTIARHAQNMRNDVAHQNANLNDCLRGLSNLQKLAAAIGAKDVERAIAKMMPPTISAADLLARSAETRVAVHRHIEAGRFTEAMNALTQVLSSVPTDAATRTAAVSRQLAALYADRARVEMKLNRLDLAREDAEDAVQAEPKKQDHYVLLAEVLLERSLVAEADAVCTEGLKINPRHEGLAVTKRNCGARLSTQDTDWNSSKLPHATDAASLQQAWEATRADHAARTPLPSDIRIIRMSELAEYFPESQAASAHVFRAHQLRDGSFGAARDFKAAREEYSNAAKKGSAEGLYTLGVFLASGMGGGRDDDRAIECWRAAVKQKPWFQFEASDAERAEMTRQGVPSLMCNIGVREAENSLGNTYRDGRCVDKNLAAAAEWYLKAAEHGDATGMNNLGYFLVNGISLPRDEASARIWYKRAADCREPTPAEAMTNYAELCLDGRGGPRDVDEALKYYRMAAKRGMPGAAEAIQRIERSTAGSAHSGPTSSPILDPNMADTWWLLARNCELGEGGSIVDLEQAAGHYRKAIELKHLFAPYELAHLLNVKLKRPLEAFPVMKQAAEAGHPLAQFQLAQMYAFGHGCARDESAATRWQTRGEQQTEVGWIKFQRAKPEKLPILNLEHGRELCKWEITQQPRLRRDGVTFMERIQRHALGKMSNMPGAPSEMLSGIQDIINMMNESPAELSRNSIHADVTQWMPLVEERAAAGSKTAKAVLQSHAMVAQAAQLVINCVLAGATDLVQAVETLDARTINSILGTLRQAFRLWDLHTWAGVQLDIFHAVAERVLKTDPNHADALFFHARHFEGSAAERIARFEHLVRLHPRDADMRHSLACSRGFGPQPDLVAQLVDMERAIELDGMMVHWRYDLGSCLRLQNTEASGQRALVEYQRYLDGSEADARKVPDAHYSMGSIHLLRDRTELARQQYHKGLAAEIHRLPCLTPIGTFPPKCTLSMLLGLESAYSLSSASPQQPACATCNYAGTLRRQRCTVCKVVFYCDRECQKRHHKAHRPTCKRSAGAAASSISGDADRMD